MPFEDAPERSGWSAELGLAFVRRAGRTVLMRRARTGPLHVQKALYPEGEGVCHAIVVHPPGGIAGGDALTIDIEAEARAHVLLTTPGATKWYRSNGARATQRVGIRAREGSVVEWLPQESIVFDSANARMSLDVRLDPGAVFVGMEVLCLGRPACGERLSRARLEVATTIRRGDASVWIERGQIDRDDPLLDSPIGFGGEPVVGTLLAAAPGIDHDLRDACREERPAVGRGAVTLLPDLLIARYLGPGCEPGRAWLANVWSRLRPALTTCAPIVPRIWST